MPNPSPTTAQIELTREVLALSSYAETSGLIDALGDAQWAAQIADNDLWQTKRNSVTVIDSTVKIDPGSLLGRIRNRSRLRFGLAPLAGDATDAKISNSGAIQSVQWF